MPNAYNYSNTAIQTTLAGNVSAGATSLTVDATTGFPSVAPYVLAVDYGAATEELVLVTTAGGTALTVTRGFGGTSAQSHSIGAVVRHVVNAQDLIDFRTHEAATAAAHGITGSFVGTTDTQTLTNKTLTSPTLSSGALSGTFTGSPTFSGAVALSGGGALSGTFTGAATFSGGLNFTNGFTVSGSSGASAAATSGTTAWRARVTGDSVDRWAVTGDGTAAWGDGTNARDVSLYRSGAATLRTDGNLTVDNNLTVSNVTTVNTLLATTITPGSTTIPSASLLTASSGWTVSSLTVGVLKAGEVTANINYTRSGGNITINSAGALSTGVIQMGTINSTYAPKADLGTLYMHAGNSIATGTARIDAAGVYLVRWQANQTISTGDIVSATITYPV